MSAERNTLAGAAWDGSVVGSRSVTYRLPSRPMQATACSHKCVGQCLSRMRGNSYVWFSGEGATATPPSYPSGLDSPRFRCLWVIHIGTLCGSRTLLGRRRTNGVIGKLLRISIQDFRLRACRYKCRKRCQNGGNAVPRAWRGATFRSRAEFRCGGLAGACVVRPCRGRDGNLCIGGRATFRPVGGVMPPKHHESTHCKVQKSVGDPTGFPCGARRRRTCDLGQGNLVGANQRRGYPRKS